MERRAIGGSSTARPWWGAERALWAAAAMLGVMLGTAGVAASADAADGVKIGYLDTLKVFEQSKIGKKSKGLLEEFVKSRQKIIDLEEAEIKELEDTLTKQEAVLSPEAKRTKQEDLQKKFVAYQKKAADLNREIQDKKSDVLSDFHQQLQTIVKRVAEREGYALIFDKGSGGAPEVSTLLYAKETLAITDKVLAELDKEGGK